MFKVRENLTSRKSYQLQGGCNCITNKTVAVEYSCVGQGFIVIIIIASVKLNSGTEVVRIIKIKL